MKKKINFIVTEDFATSYGNEMVYFHTGDKVWEYEDEIFLSHGVDVILAKSHLGNIIGFIPLKFLRKE